MTWPFPYITVVQAWEFVHAAQKNENFLREWTEQARDSLVDNPKWDNISVREALMRLGHGNAKYNGLAEGHPISFARVLPLWTICRTSRPLRAGSDFSDGA